MNIENIVFWLWVIQGLILLSLIGLIITTYILLQRVNKLEEDSLNERFKE